MLSLFSLFACTKAEKTYDVKPIFTEMRNLAFSITPEQINIKPNEGETFAVFMECGYPDAVISLRCMGDGAISIYFTNGGGMIGIGEHENAKNEGLKLIQLANEFTNKAKIVDQFPIPIKGETIFYIRTRNGVYMIEEEENKLGNNQSEYSPLFYQAQNVITQARLVQENK